jgi:tyrosyl-tRNA synthetase
MVSLGEQLKILLDGAEQVVPADEFERRLAAAVRHERPPLRVKFGVDPTSPDIHLGHTVVLRKLRDFQRLDHTAVLIIGGFTAQVGDPSGRSTTRPRLSREEVDRHAATYVAQARKVLLDQPLELVNNADWLAGMSMSEVLTLASHATVAQLLQREDFAARYASGRSIAVAELLYPLLQGQDSVAVHSDVELGGTDQTFNLLVGRDLQQASGQPPQCVLTMPLLEGTDGQRKMSKTAGNAIGIDEPPAEMFGKLMSIPDELIVKYFRLLTDCGYAEVDALAEGLASGRLHPGESKRRLALAIVAQYHSAADAAAAENRFNLQFRDRGVPEDAPEFDLGTSERWFLPALLMEAGLVASGSEARRMVAQGAVRLDGKRLEDPLAELVVAALCGRVLQVGKRRFARLVCPDR